MTGLMLQFSLLALVIILAGTLLATAADRIGKLTTIGGTLSGFFLLAGATSLPELVINCDAAKLGAADLALGDLLGSSIFNLLILGAIDLAHRSHVRILSSVSAAHSLSATTSIVLTAIVLLGIVMPFDREFLGIGVAPWLIAFVYLMSVRLIFFDQLIAQHTASELNVEKLTAGMSLPRSVACFVIAAFIVFVTGPFLAESGNRLAIETGLGGTFVGTTLVALTTSLPEIITTLVAVRMGAYELAAGSIFGSNCFNVAILPLVDAFYDQGPILQAVEISHAVTACFVIIITGLAIMGLLYRVEKRYWLIEPDALLIVVLSVASLIAIAFLNGA